MNQVAQKIITARLGILRSDWNPERFGNEVSFWSRDDDQIFQVGGDIAPDGGLESSYITVASFAGSVTVQIMNSSGTKSIASFHYDDNENDEYGGARAYVGEQVAPLLRNQQLADDVAWLTLSNGEEVMTDGDWADVVDGDWFAEAGGGDQLYVDDSKFAGGVFLDVVSARDVSVTLSSDVLEFDCDEAAENRADDTRFVGVAA